MVESAQEQRDERAAVLAAERQAVEEAEARAAVDAANGGSAPQPAQDSRHMRAAKAEADYRALEAKLKEQLGLAPAQKAAGG
jgi:hypothetical protein